MTKPDVSRRYAPGIDLSFKFNFLLMKPDLVQTRKSVIPTNAFDHHCTSSFGTISYTRRYCSHLYISDLAVLPFF